MGLEDLLNQQFLSYVQQRNIDNNLDYDKSNYNYRRDNNDNKKDDYKDPTAQDIIKLYIEGHINPQDLQNRLINDYGFHPKSSNAIAQQFVQHNYINRIKNSQLGNFMETFSSPGTGSGSFPYNKGGSPGGNVHIGNDNEPNWNKIK